MIISFWLDSESGGDWGEGDDWGEGGGSLASMVQARSDLAAGDLRLLYLG